MLSTRFESEIGDKIRVAGIVDDSITDGPGLRITIFTQGCPHHCKGCHNSEALEIDGGELYTSDQLFARIKKNPIISGVTLSGGEPMIQAKALLALAKEIKQAGLDLAIYTGYTIEEILASQDEYKIALVECADTLIDGPFILEKRNLKLAFRGSENQRMLDAKASVKQNRAVLI